MRKTLLIMLITTCLTVSLRAGDIPLTVDPGLDSIIQRYHMLGRYDGAVLVARGEEILHAGGYGLANMELGVANSVHTRFDIGSVSKQFTAAAILLLHQRGRLDLNAPVSTYMPEYPKPQGEQVTIHHLLTHTSGIPSIGRRDGLQDVDEDGNPITLDELIALSWDKPLQFEPGSTYRYNNTAYAILCKLVETISGKEYSRFLTEELFVPAGMVSTMVHTSERTLIPDRATGYIGFKGDEQRAPFIHPSWSIAGGGVRSTAVDLYRWYLALRNRTLLDARHTELFFKRHWEHNQRSAYGYGWFLFHLFDMPVRNHGGTTMGFVTEFTIIPELDLLIIAMSNHQPAFGIDQPWEVTKAVTAHVTGAPYPLPPVLSPAKQLREDLEGLYGTDGELLLRVVREGADVFVVAEGDKPWSPLDIRNVAAVKLTQEEQAAATRIMEAILTVDHQAFRGTLTERMAEQYGYERFREMADRLNKTLGPQVAWRMVEVNRGERISSYLVHAKGEAGSRIFELNFASNGLLGGFFTFGAPPTRIPLQATSDGRWLVDGFNWRKHDLIFSLESGPNGPALILEGQEPLQLRRYKAD